MKNRKLLLLKEFGHCFCAILEEDRLVQLEGFGDDETEELGNIYVGRVENIVKNINAAFISYGKKGEKKYAYLDLSVYENIKPEQGPVFTKHAGTPSKHKTEQSGVAIHMQDELIIQISKPAVKLKRATATCEFQLPGKFLVYFHGIPKIAVSSKIKDKQKRKEFTEMLQPYLTKTSGILVRTNAMDASGQEILSEAEFFKNQYEAILSEGIHQTSGTCLYREAPAYLRCLKNEKITDHTEILVEDEALYREAMDYVKKFLPEDVDKIHRYENPGISLFHLYGIRHKIEKAAVKHVWLKSGGFLVIEPTEALTVIDVNTGKAIDGKKSREDTFFLINLEAAKEIAYQLRVRNLSGIIIIDFIDMKDKDKTAQLIREFRQYIASDPVKCDFVGMTKLHLAEMTRQKTGKPLHERMTESIRQQIFHTTEGDTNAK